MNKLEIIALYLPQFYPFKENNEWWGPGFTEWTNVAKARPLFKGHEQPKIPADLSFYDLRLPLVREQQVELARKAGVTAFCYWHYWFGNGKRLLANVFDDVLESGKPDFPFCLGWANHSWEAKTWAKDMPNKMLMEQTYPGINDARMHFDYLLKAFKDPRYVKIDNKPFFLIFDSETLPKEYIEWFRMWSKEEGFDDLFLVSYVFEGCNKQEQKNKGYSAVVFRRLNYATWAFRMGKLGDFLYKLKNRFMGVVYRRPRRVFDYRKYYPKFIKTIDREEDVIPAILPGYDHSPRSGDKGIIFTHNAPQFFYYHVKQALEMVRNKRNKILLLRSWNEWGEGNYIEPDLKYGHGYLDALEKAVSEFVEYNKQ